MNVPKPNTEIAVKPHTAKQRLSQPIVWAVVALIISLWCVYDDYRNRSAIAHLTQATEARHSSAGQTLDEMRRHQANLNRSLATIKISLNKQTKQIHDLEQDFSRRLHSLPQPAISLLRYAQVAYLIWDAELSLKQYGHVSQAIKQLNQAKSDVTALNDSQSLIKQLDGVIVGLNKISEPNTQTLLSEISTLKQQLLPLLFPTKIPKTDQKSSHSSVKPTTSEGWQEHLKHNLTLLSKIVVVKKQARNDGASLLHLSSNDAKRRFELLFQELTWAITFRQQQAFAQSLSTLEALISQAQLDDTEKNAIKQHINKLGHIDLQPELPDFGDLVSTTLKLAAVTQLSPQSPME